MTLDWAPSLVLDIWNSSLHAPVAALRDTRPSREAVAGRVCLPLADFHHLQSRPACQGRGRKLPLPVWTSSAVRESQEEIRKKDDCWPRPVLIIRIRSSHSASRRAFVLRLHAMQRSTLRGCPARWPHGSYKNTRKSGVNIFDLDRQELESLHPNFPALLRLQQ